MSNENTKRDLLPAPFETCAVCDHESIKRNALLFDRVHVFGPAYDVPEEVLFRIASVDKSMVEELEKLALSVSYGGTPGDAAAYSQQYTAAEYCNAGILATPAYNSRLRLYTDFSQGEKIAYDAALNNIPVFDDRICVSWDQIVEFRNDVESKRKYRDLRVWLHEGLKTDSVAHATDIIAQKIEDYAWALKKHGFQTVLGAISQFFDWKQSAVTLAVSGAVGAMEGPIWGAISSGLLISSQAAVRIAQERIKITDVARSDNREVAILYDIQERFGDHYRL